MPEMSPRGALPRPMQRPASPEDDAAGVVCQGVKRGGGRRGQAAQSFW
jgi:hypothetical protein